MPRSPDLAAWANRNLSETKASKSHLGEEPRAMDKEGLWVQDRHTSCVSHCVLFLRCVQQQIPCTGKDLVFASGLEKGK